MKVASSTFEKQRGSNLENDKDSNGLDDTGEFEEFREGSEDITKPLGDAFCEYLANIGGQFQAVASRAVEASRNARGASDDRRDDIARENIKFGELAVGALEEYLRNLKRYLKR